MLKRILQMVILGISVVLTGCNRGPGQDRAEFARQAAPVKAAVVSRQDLSRTLVYSGTLEPVRVAAILPDMPGKIQSLQVNIGDPVREGQRLAVMENSTLKYQLDQARAGLSVAEANLVDAEKNWQRTQNLYQEQAISDQQYEKARLGYQAAQAQRDQAEATHNLLNHQYRQTVLRSPFDGVITSRGYEEGDLVNPGMARGPVYTVMDVTALKVGLLVPLSEIDLIRKSQTAFLDIKSAGNRSYPGVVNIVNVAAETGSKTFYVETLFQNPDGFLRPGTFGNVRIEVERRDAVLVVPRAALLEGDEVFVIRNDKAYRTPITPGLITPDRLEVAAGLQERDTVVVEGAYTLVDSSAVQVEVGGI
ncbi:MAG: efflux RND transporter periplasmic adaptor subunit [Fidelibacterota bacterium]|nr:MAG: efflux RND transporter periplasmic adaptor subunit [Candidatus Neomarinimicrobiota bacterium]